VSGILIALATVAGGGIVSLMGAIFLGKLVPASRAEDAKRDGEIRLAELRAEHAAEVAELKAAVDKAQQEAVTWKASHDSIKAAFDGQTKLLERQQLTAEITDKAMTAVRELLASGGSK
jgi:hypothetical protein